MRLWVTHRAWMIANVVWLVAGISISFGLLFCLTLFSELNQPIPVEGTFYSSEQYDKCGVGQYGVEYAHIGNRRYDSSFDEDLYGGQFRELPGYSLHGRPTESGLQMTSNKKAIPLESYILDEVDSTCFEYPLQHDLEYGTVERDGLYILRDELGKIYEPLSYEIHEGASMDYLRDNSFLAAVCHPAGRQAMGFPGREIDMVKDISALMRFVAIGGGNFKLSGVNAKFSTSTERPQFIRWLERLTDASRDFITIYEKMQTILCPENADLCNYLWAHPSPAASQEELNARWMLDAMMFTNNYLETPSVGEPSYRYVYPQEYGSGITRKLTVPNMMGISDSQNDPLLSRSLASGYKLRMVGDNPDIPRHQRLLLVFNGTDLSFMINGAQNTTPLDKWGYKDIDMYGQVLFNGALPTNSNMWSKDVYAANTMSNIGDNAIWHQPFAALNFENVLTVYRQWNALVLVDSSKSFDDTLDDFISSMKAPSADEMLLTSLLDHNLSSVMESRYIYSKENGYQQPPTKTAEAFVERCTNNECDEAGFARQDNYIHASVHATCLALQSDEPFIKEAGLLMKHILMYQQNPIMEGAEPDAPLAYRNIYKDLPKYPDGLSVEAKAKIDEYISAFSQPSWEDYRTEESSWGSFGSARTNNSYVNEQNTCRMELLEWYLQPAGERGAYAGSCELASRAWNSFGTWSAAEGIPKLVTGTGIESGIVTEIGELPCNPQVSQVLTNDSGASNGMPVLHVNSAKYVLETILDDRWTTRYMEALPSGARKSSKRLGYLESAVNHGPGDLMDKWSMRLKMQPLFSALVTLPIVVIVTVLTARFQKERQSQVMSYLKVLGLSRWHYYGESYIFDAVFLLTTALIAAIGIATITETWTSSFTVIYLLWFFTACQTLALNRFCLSLTNKNVVIGVSIAFAMNAMNIWGLMRNVDTPSVTLHALAAIFWPCFGIPGMVDQLIQLQQWRSDLCNGLTFTEMFTRWHHGGLPGMDAIYALIGTVIYLSLAHHLFLVHPLDGMPKKKWWLDLWGERNVGNESSEYEEMCPESIEEGVTNALIFKYDSTSNVALRALNIAHEFPDGGETFRALDGVSIDIHTGEIVCLLGHNGAGKTTLINIITGQIEPTSGSYFTEFAHSESSMAAGIGFCPQFDVFFPYMTLREHLELVARIKAVRLEDAQELAKVLELEYHLDHNIKELSGGQQRRASIAMALVGGPRIVILDEPTTGIDPATRRTVWAAMNRIRADRAVLFTTHFLDEADHLADRIAIMAEGKITALGTPEQLKHGVSKGLILTCIKSMAHWSAGMHPFHEGIIERISGASINTHTALEISYSVPETDETHVELVSVLRDLERDGDGCGILSFSLAVASIEEVFLEAGRKKVDNVVNLDQDGNKATEIFTRYDEYAEPCFSAQFRACLLKLWLYSTTIRSLQIWTPLWYIPFLGVLLFGVFAASGVEVSPSATGSSVVIWNNPNYKGLVLEVVSTMPDYVVDCLEVTSGFKIETVNFDPDPQWNASALGRVQYGADGGLVLFHNSGGYRYALTVIQEALGRCLFSHHLGDGAFAFSEHPDSDVLNSFSYSSMEQYRVLSAWDIGNYENDDQGYIMSFVCFAMFILLLSASTLSVGYMVFRERTWNVKHLQTLNGVSELAYWLSLWVYQVVLLNGGIFLALAVTMIFKGSLVFSGKDIGYLCPVLIAFTVPQILHVFWSSFLFGTKRKRHAAVWGRMGTVIGILALVTTPFFYSMADYHSSENTGTALFQFVRFADFVMCIVWPLGWVGSVFGQMIEARYYCLESWSDRDELPTSCRLWPLDENGGDQSVIGNPWIWGSTFWGGSEITQEEGVGYMNPGVKSTTALLVFWIICTGFQCGMLCLMSYRDIHVSWLRSKQEPKDELTCCMKNQIKSNRKKELKEWKKLCKIAEKNGHDLPPEPTIGSEDSDEEVYNEYVEQERIRIRDRTPQDEQPMVDVRGLRKVYPAMPRLVAVNDLWLDVPRGVCFGLLGQNGAGKTTAIDIMVGQTLANAGDAVFDGVSINDSQGDVYKKLGFCPQFRGFWPNLTGRQTLTFLATNWGIPSSMMYSFVEELMDLLGISEFADRQVSKYSGGNKRKLNVAMAFMGNPKVVFLDEPTSGVDPGARRKLWGVIQSALHGGDRSIILTTHVMEECEALCSKIGIMRKGVMRYIGSPSSVKREAGKWWMIELIFRVPVTNTEEQTIAERDISNKFGVGSFEVVEKYARRYRIKISQRIVTFADMFEYLSTSQNDIGIKSFSLGEVTLDSIFVSLNGGVLDEEGNKLVECTDLGQEEDRHEKSDLAKKATLAELSSDDSSSHN